VQEKALFSPSLILALFANLWKNGLILLEAMFWKDIIVTPKDGHLLSNSTHFTQDQNFGTKHLKWNPRNNISQNGRRWLTDISLVKL